MTIRTDSGFEHTVVPGQPWRSRADNIYARGVESAEDLVALGCTIIPDPVPAEPSLDTLKTAAQLAHDNAAELCIIQNIPQPWDILEKVASAEFRTWVYAFVELVAAELTRVTQAVASATTAAELASIVADWPEVE